MHRSDASLASLLLVNRLVESGVEPLKPKEFWRIVEEVQDPARLLRMKDGELTAVALGVDVPRIRSLLASSTQLAFELERLGQAGIEVLSPFDEKYPTRLRYRLRDAAPPILHAAGPLDLLQEDGLGVVGSRDVSPQQEDVARAGAKLAVSLGLSVVSGAAKGADIAAMAAAFDAGGTVVGVLADSLDRRLRQPDVRRAIGEERLTLVSPYKPDAGFSVASAMSRNKLIYGLSKLTLVVASDLEEGGTWFGAQEALRKGYSRVVVWRGPGEGRGNPALSRLGAEPLSDVEELRGFLLEPVDDSTQPPSDSDQLSLEL